MHKLKRLMRMYNQAQLLASEIAKLANIPLANDLLLKVKWTKAQTTLTKIERQKNLAGSIEFNPKYNIKNQKKILLIDDVITTGSTINICVKLLKKNQAKSVTVLTIATT